MKKLKMTPDLLKRYNNQKNTKRGKKIVSGYTHIVYGTDQDLDGFHIRGLLSGFFHRYMIDCIDHIGILQTPVIAVSKNKSLQRWYYNSSDDVVVKRGEHPKWMKGLGTWNEKDLRHIVEVDGLGKMIQKVEFDSAKIIDEWLGDDSAPRKSYIVENDFNIAKS